MGREIEEVAAAGKPPKVEKVSRLDFGASRLLDVLEPLADKLVNQVAELAPFVNEHLAGRLVEPPDSTVVW
jgi:hypothetical protein